MMQWRIPYAGDLWVGKSLRIGAFQSWAVLEMGCPELGSLLGVLSESGTLWDCGSLRMELFSLHALSGFSSPATCQSPSLSSRSSVPFLAISLLFQ